VSPQESSNIAPPPLLIAKGEKALLQIELKCVQKEAAEQQKHIEMLKFGLRCAGKTKKMCATCRQIAS
jgi:hypothetical protein